MSDKLKKIDLYGTYTKIVLQTCALILLTKNSQKTILIFDEICRPKIFLRRCYYYFFKLLLRSFVYVNGGIFSGYCTFDALNHQI